MVAMAIDMEQLYALVGQRVVYGGRHLMVVDVLTEGPSLVLNEPEGAGQIQRNRFGEASRRAPTSWTIPVLDPATGEIHPLLRELVIR